MLFPRPKKRVLPPGLDWKIVPVVHGNPVKGWVAGPVVPIAAHWHKKRQCSLPCRSFMTSGKLICGCEARKLQPRNIGYCPLITPTRDKIVIVLSETVMESVECLRVGTPIQFTRPKAAKRPLFWGVLPDSELGTEPTKRMKQIKGHEIEEYLCHVWQDRELTEAFGFQFHPATGGDENGKYRGPGDALDREDLEDSPRAA